MKGSRRDSGKLSITILVSMLLLMTGSLAVDSSSKKLPKGDWTLSSHPLWESEELVNVFSVTTRFDGLTVTKVGVENNSNKLVSGVKLQWFIVQVHAGKSGPEKYDIKASGDTPVITPPGGIPAGATAELEYPVTRFLDHIPAFLNLATRMLSGQYRIYVGVNEVHYDDGTVQALSLPDPCWWCFDPIFEDCNFCAKQHCEWSPSRGSYICADSLNCERCTNNGDSCTNSRCPSGPIQ